MRFLGTKLWADSFPPEASSNQRFLGVAPQSRFDGSVVDVTVDVTEACHAPRAPAPGAFCIVRKVERARSFAQKRDEMPHFRCAFVALSVRRPVIFEIDARTFVDDLKNSGYAFPTYNFSHTRSCERYFGGTDGIAETCHDFSKCLSIVDCNGTSLALQRRTFEQTWRT